MPYNDYLLQQQIDNLPITGETTTSGINILTWSGAVQHTDSFPKYLFDLPKDCFINRVDFFTDTAPSGISYGSTAAGNDDGGGTQTFIILGATIPNDSLLTQFAIYSTAAAVVKLKLASKEATADTTFNIEYLQTVSHAGGGWQWFTLTTPKKIPIDRYWFPAFWLVSGALTNTFLTAGTVDRYVNTDVTGINLATSASSGHRKVQIKVAPTLSLTASGTGVNGYVASSIHMGAAGSAVITYGDLNDRILSKTNAIPIYLNLRQSPMASGVGNIYIDYGPYTYVSNLSPENVILTGVGVARPAAGVNGRLYLPTDGYYMSRDNGASWDTYVGGGFKCSNPPASGTLTFVSNAGTTTLTPDGDGQLLTQMGSNSSSTSFSAYLASVPAAPYSFVVGLEITRTYPLTHSYIGVCLTNGTTTAASVVSYAMLNTMTENVQQWTNWSTWNANSFAGTAPGFPMLGTFFLRIRDDNTTRYFEISKDGRTFSLTYSASRTTFITPTHLGLHTGHSTTAVGTSYVSAQAKIFHWSLA